MPEPELHSIVANGKRGNEGRRKWTVMVFMGVTHVEGVAAPLTAHADADVAEMKKVFADGPSDSLNVFVQRHDGGIPTREWIGKSSGPENVRQGQRDAVNGNALQMFMIDSLQRANHQPGDVSVLILWGHAYHFALGHTETPTGIEALDFGELRTVLTELQKAIVKDVSPQWASSSSAAETQAPRLDILAFDACDLSSIEVANHMGPFVDYMIASQIGIPLPGWPYDTILGRLKAAAQGTGMTPAEFGAFAVRKFCEEYFEQDENKNPIPVSLTLLDLAKAREASEAVERLAELLAIAGGTDGSELLRIRDLFAQSQTIPGKPFIDVADFCLNITRHSAFPAVRDAAATLGDILIRPASNGNGNRARGSFIVDHSRNLHSTARLHGVSLYAPQLASDDWRGQRFFYNKFASSRESSWSRLVHVLAEGR